MGKRGTFLSATWPIAFILIVPATCHWLFSWMGFNPTDDGLFLALSRHVADGLVPYRDFIAIHPPGTALLYVPLIQFGGDSVLWLSRGIMWLEWAIITVAWVSILTRLRPAKIPWWEQCLAALLAYTVSVHTFPALVWNTTDGLLFVSLGVLLLLRSAAAWRVVGWLLVGSACLFKANFALIIPLTLIILRPWRRDTAWVAAFVPGIGFVLYLAVTGLLPDAWMQLTSTTNFVKTGIWQYFRRWGPVGFLIGYLAGRVLSRPFAGPDSGAREIQTRWLARAGLYALPLIGGIWGLWSTSIDRFSVVLFGILGGLVVQSFRTGGQIERSARRLVVLVLTVAWCASLSIGYNWPALMSGAMLIAVLWWPFPAHDWFAGWLRRPAVLTVATLVFIVAFAVGRRDEVYRERSVNALTESLDMAVAGGARIKTNPNTMAMLAELDSLTAAIQNRGGTYAIIPGVAANWVRAQQANPLPMDWIHPVAVNNPQLRERLIAALAGGRDSLTLIVQTVDPRHLAWRSDELEAGELRPLLDSIARYYRKSDSLPYFDVFEPRTASDAPRTY